MNSDVTKSNLKLWSTQSEWCRIRGRLTNGVDKTGELAGGLKVAESSSTTTVSILSKTNVGLNSDLAFYEIKPLQIFD